MSGQAQEFTQALQELYAAAGSPRLADIVAFDAMQVKPVEFKDSTLSDWFNGETVPSKARAVEVLTAFLENRASRHPGHTRRTPAEWEKLRAAARGERQASHSKPATNLEAGNVPPEDVESVAMPGVPIELCDPVNLEVHPAADGPGRDTAAVLPGYVPRAHDTVLAAVVAQAAAGRSAMAVLVGSSSTGKTRALWEAVRAPEALSQDWRLWHPTDASPTRADAALSGLAAVGPHTVVWLNEAQHYLGVNEKMPAALHALLTDPSRAPVLVLGTLWPEYDRAYTAPSAPGGTDPYARVRELLAGRRIAVPDAFDEAALAAAQKLAKGGDRLLAAVLARRHDGRVAQHLAGAPELLERYRGASPAARALLDAAGDAHRLGVGPHLSLELLAQAADDPAYLGQDAYDTLADDWLEQALAELAEPVFGNLAPLRRIRHAPEHRPPSSTLAARPAATPTGPRYRLTDYLEQHTRHERRRLCPPASFWSAALRHLTNPDELYLLAAAAERRHRLQWADALYRPAADAGDTEALTRLAGLRERAKNLEDAEILYRRAIRAGDDRALFQLAELRLQAGDREGAEILYRRAIDAGDERALYRLARLLEQAGDREGAEAVLRRAANFGDVISLHWLADLREQAGDHEGAKALRWDAAGAEIAFGVYRERWVGARERAETPYRAPGDISDISLYQMAEVREETGDREGAEALLQDSVNAGDSHALFRLARLRERAGDHKGAKNLERYGLNPDGTPAAPWSWS